MKTTLKFLAFIIIVSVYSLKAQDTTGVTIGDTLLPPHPSAVLELKSLNKGFLTTRLSTAQRDSISNPANGLLVYDTDLNKYFYYADSLWLDLSGADYWQKADTNGGIVYNTGNVGIGVDTPKSTLHLSGTMSAQLENYAIVLDTAIGGMPISGAAFIKSISPANIIFSGILDVSAMGGNENAQFNIYADLQNNIFNQVQVRESNVYISSKNQSLNSETEFRVAPDYFDVHLYDLQNNNNYSNLSINNQLISLQKMNASGKSSGFNMDSTAISIALSKDSSLNNYFRLDKDKWRLHFSKADSITEVVANTNGLTIRINGGGYDATFARNGTLETNFKISTDSSINASQYLLNGVPLNFGSSVWNTDSLPNIFYNEGNVGIGTSNPITNLNVVGDVLIKYNNAFWAMGDSLIIENDTLNSMVLGYKVNQGSDRFINAYVESLENNQGGIVSMVSDSSDDYGSAIFLSKGNVNIFSSTDTSVAGVSMNENGLSAFGGSYNNTDRMSTFNLSENMSSVGYSYGLTYGTGIIMDYDYGFQASLIDNGAEINTKLTINPDGNFKLSLSNNNVNPTVDFSIANGWLYKGKDTTETMFTLQDSLERDLFYVKNNSRAYFKGNVGINITNPSEKLHVDGNILASGSITQNSDARLKTGITTLTNSLSKLSLLRGVSYYWKDKEKSTQQQIGLIAQEVEKIYPELVGSDNNGNKTVNYIGLIAPLIEAVKELGNKTEEINTLNKKVEMLESKLDFLLHENKLLKAEK
jgi:hypothetical protein